ncbi:protein sprouty homolog 2 [Brienomyrus brachyistius]|uniref:protein sprouty homolog 2 n=1 Tax=Brienomyrus brachyistius TaxID=42636 RepID=UPI0020B3E055|nr:protein sprouty homolog 2 [Brienomyrus brachyistius]
MESRTPSGSQSAGLQAELHSGRASQPVELHSRDDLGLRFQPLSLSQIQTVRSTNEYTEGPMVAPRPGSRPVTEQPSVHKAERAQGLNDGAQDRCILGGPQQDPQDHSSPPAAALAWSMSTMSSGSRNCPRTSTSSTSSGQRLLEPCLAEEGVEAPERLEAKAEKLMPAGGAESSGHRYVCEDCGRCRCEECTSPQTLPSCWFCSHRCVCSAQDAVDYSTCLCCAKCLFYHCSTDDEDVCADEPCSCGQTKRCVRWTALAVLSLLLPCMWCYLPAKGCLKLCQSCYDGMKRPGCRCKACRPVKKPT